MNNAFYMPYYGNWRNRTFADIFSSFEVFSEEWKQTVFASVINDNDLEILYYLLYSRYGNSVVAASDENRFKYQLFSITFQYGPTWAKELELQKEIRELSEDELREGTRNTVNNAENPSSAPSTVDTEELPYVNNQNVSKTKRSRADAFALLNALLKKDVTEDFIKKFQKLFLIIVAPEEPLWYVTYPEEEI